MKSARDVVANMLLACELHESGLALMKQKLMRESNLTRTESVEVQFRRWMLREDDPMPGDVSGPVHVRRSLP